MIMVVVAPAGVPTKVVQFADVLGDKSRRVDRIEGEVPIVVET